MHTQDHPEALIEQSLQQAKLLDDKFVADETFPHIILCSSTPQAQKMANIIAAKFSLPHWPIPVKTIGSLDDYDDAPDREKDFQSIQDIQAVMNQHSVVLVITGPLRVEGISSALGQEVRLKNESCSWVRTAFCVYPSALGHKPSPPRKISLSPRKRKEKELYVKNHRNQMLPQSF